MKTRDHAIFLITSSHKVVAQFPVSREFLLERSNPIKDFMNTDMIHRYIVKKNKGSHSLPIRDLRTGMSQVSLKAKVLEIPKPKLVFTRFGNYVSVANALIADETRTIRLCLWNEQISAISVGSIIQIEKAHMSLFRGEPQLRSGKNGTLSNVEDLGSQLKEVHSS